MSGDAGGCCRGLFLLATTHKTYSMFAHAAWTKEKTVTGPGDAVLGAVIGNRGISTCLAEKTMRISLSC